jgi:hypothetical protein
MGSTSDIQVSLSCAAIHRKLDSASHLRVEDRKNQEACAIALRSDRSIGVACCPRYLLACWMVLFDDFGSYGSGVTFGRCSNADPSSIYGGRSQNEAHKHCEGDKGFLHFGL